MSRLAEDNTAESTGDTSVKGIIDAQIKLNILKIPQTTQKKLNRNKQKAFGQLVVTPQTYRQKYLTY